ncbi:MAG: dethiobiotin synthase [Verrucomicrobia bacterium]|nr:dethiobiotin synthase [Verrucomicrobiota bacterium]
MRAFLTGTDTGVGKTFVTALLARALRRAGLDTIALKPICSGDRGDAEILRAACDSELEIDEVNPMWFQAPVAPYLAACREGCAVSLPALESWFRSISKGRQSVLVEGAGGWLVPIAEKLLIADLAAALGLPVIVVVANRLGCINHTLLTIESIRSRGLECRGIILNSPVNESGEPALNNRSLVEEFTDVPVLFEITPGQEAIEIGIA